MANPERRSSQEPQKESDRFLDKIAGLVGNVTKEDKIAEAFGDFIDQKERYLTFLKAERTKDNPDAYRQVFRAKQNSIIEIYRNKQYRNAYDTVSDLITEYSNSYYEENTTQPSKKDNADAEYITLQEAALKNVKKLGNFKN